MSKTIEHLLKNSHLPGPRGNLELLGSFSKTASAKEISECLSYCHDDLHNSPEEFVVMCGIVGFCIKNSNHIKKTLSNIRKYASHSSWRIREAVAIGIQEMTENNTKEILENLKVWINGNDLEKRAVVAALCEPKLLKEKTFILELLEILKQITMPFAKIEGKLSENQNSLRKTLGYGWSVAIVSLPKEGKACFEKIAKNKNKQIQWIVKENLKKNRLKVMDKTWVETLQNIV
ncbi:hypothetical protein EHQ23_18320 [Leptospira bourretii]|uniref:HEAT repeat domain-containing protein n=1 Tax=Leptospira bourretii TaxID=2484962 RepID=A0A4R9IJZ9_9LEPT|nr:hypothetical protein [Leptospira bourretii]TGK79555.1 hypothetical protein EHQ23_18320 [Leptospira bourretii]TGK89763.1 hypothetical protein EHQ26_15170 [Leptospira bourretii]TGL19474.1 hypothetical protein EHQ47_15290 [Leptospira bourretii]TGL35950.1 hypothetical protein EHQ45_08130 [Leptospira bourretii]